MARRSRFSYVDELAEVRRALRILRRVEKSLKAREVHFAKVRKRINAPGARDLEADIPLDLPEQG